MCKAARYRHGGLIEPSFETSVFYTLCPLQMYPRLGSSALCSILLTFSTYCPQNNFSQFVLYQRLVPFSRTAIGQDSLGCLYASYSLSLEARDSLPSCCGCCVSIFACSYGAPVQEESTDDQTVMTCSRLRNLIAFF